MGTTTLLKLISIDMSMAILTNIKVDSGGGPISNRKYTNTQASHT